jgi:glycosyltransferase involved in cell wall biosynthesis
MPESITCAAILAVRNEACHIRRILPAFIGQGIDVVVIDNDSTDETAAICRQYLGKGVLFMERVAWTGCFDLSAQLEAKKDVAARLDHDWLIHTDADEWMQSPQKDETLLEGICRVSAQGFNAINFDEFVFLPVDDKSKLCTHYEREILHYYFFEPCKNRLMRAWQRNANLSNRASGGHRLAGDKLKISAEPFILRHYIALSQQDALNKYVGRTYSATDLSKSWHGNRLQLTKEQLRLPRRELLKKLPVWDAREFDRTDPQLRHFWEWGDTV